MRLYALLMDRNAGGAFDVLREYGNLSSLIRVFLGWRDEPLFYEAQCGTFCVVGEEACGAWACVWGVWGMWGVGCMFVAMKMWIEGLVSII